MGRSKATFGAAQSWLEWALKDILNDEQLEVSGGNVTIVRPGDSPIDCTVSVTMPMDLDGDLTIIGTGTQLLRVDSPSE